MAKIELAMRIALEVELPVNQVQRIVQLVLDNLIDAVVEDGRLELRGFGILYIKECRPRRARNPRTGVSVQVPAHKTVKFKPGKEIVDRILRPQKNARD